MTLDIIIASLIQRTLDYSAPLIIASMGALILERSGLLSLGTEGIMTVGAFFGIAIAFNSPFPILIVFVLAGLVAAVFYLIYGIATIEFRADQTISGMAINLIGPGIVLFASKLIFNGAVSTPSLSLEQKLPKVLNGVFKTNSFFDLILNRSIAVYIAFVLVILTYVLLNKTVLGLRIKTSGENPEAGAVLGINIKLIRYISILISGFLAGIAGAVYSLSVTSSFSPVLISGQGYIAIAAMIFGRWKPLNAMFGALLFGFTSGLEVFLKSPSINLPIPGTLLSIIPYLTTILVLVFFIKNNRPPKAIGALF